ncbi:MAG: hypothetical protein HQL52_17315 [Magnetococcales bacterium]|nr:hypothetical protein [Magnetococcales bacterium]
MKWEVRRKLAPLLYTDEARIQEKDDPVSQAHSSEEGLRKTGTRKAKKGLPLHSFQSLLRELATLCKAWFQILPDAKKPVSFPRLTTPTPLQQETFKILEITA